MPNQENPKFIIFLDISDLIVNNYDLLFRVIENWGIIVAGNGYDWGDYEGLWRSLPILSVQFDRGQLHLIVIFITVGPHLYETELKY